MDKNCVSNLGLVSGCENFGITDVFDPDLFILMSDPESGGNSDSNRN